MIVPNLFFSDSLCVCDNFGSICFIFLFFFHLIFCFVLLQTGQRSKFILSTVFFLSLFLYCFYLKYPILFRFSLIHHHHFSFRFSFVTLIFIGFVLFDYNNHHHHISSISHICCCKMQDDHLLIIMIEVNRKKKIQFNDWIEDAKPSKSSPCYLIVWSRKKRRWVIGFTVSFFSEETRSLWKFNKTNISVYEVYDRKNILWIQIKVIYIHYFNRKCLQKSFSYEDNRPTDYII